MEIGHDRIRNGVLVRREDELVGPSVVGVYLLVGSHVCFEGAHDRYADGEDLVAEAVGAVDVIGRLLGDDHPFGIHPVLGEILHVDAAEVADAHVDRDESLLDILENHAVEELAAEVRAGGGNRNGTFVRGEDRLKILRIFRGDAVLDPERDRGLAESEEGLLEFVVGPVIEETERPAARGRVVDHFRDKALVFTEIELVSDPDLTGRVDDYVPETLLPVEFPEQEDHDVRPRLLLFSIETCGEDFGVVEDEHVPLAEIIDDILEKLVLDFPGVLVEDHQPAFVSPARGFFRDPLLRESEIELREFHSCFGLILY